MNESVSDLKASGWSWFVSGGCKALSKVIVLISLKSGAIKKRLMSQGYGEDLGWGCSKYLDVVLGRAVPVDVMSGTVLEWELTG